MKRFFLILGLSVLCNAVSAQQKYHDAAMFNAPYGNVKCLEYESGKIIFCKDGSLNKEESTYLQFFSKYEIKRDEEGYPISLTTEYDTSTYEYDDTRRVSKRTIMANGSKLVFSYYFSYSTDVTVTLEEYKAGYPQKTTVLYDMNEFDFRGNWMQKGKKGERIEEQTLKREQLGTVGDCSYFLELDTKVRYIGQEKEARKISYWADTFYTFKRSDSPKEINLYSAASRPFFFPVDREAKEIEKYIKKNKIEHSRKNYGALDSYVQITIPVSDRVFFGYPITNMIFQYIAKYPKKWGKYKFTIKIEDKAEREAFVDFLIAEGEKNGTLKESSKDGLFFKDGILNFNLMMAPDGIDIFQGAPLDWVF